MGNYIKNLKINVGHIILLVAVSVTGFTVIKNISSEKEEVVTVAEEIEAMKKANMEKEVIPLDMSLAKEIDEQIDEYYTEEVLNEQMEKVAEEIVNIEEKTYSGMNVSHEYEDYIRDKCMEYSSRYHVDSDTLYKVVMTIGYRESDGKWDNNGVISDTLDYGEFQINECNLEDAEKRFGYSKDDILNDKYKNADYFIDRMCNIMHMTSCKSLEDVFGINNGWVDWKNKGLARDYSKGCMEIMNNYFGDSKEMTR